MTERGPTIRQSRASAKSSGSVIEGISSTGIYAASALGFTSGTTSTTMDESSASTSKEKTSTALALLSSLSDQKRIVAADMGRCTLGLVYWPDLFFDTLLRPKATLAVVREYFNEIMKVGPAVVIIEGYSYGSLWQAQKNAEVIGAVKYLLTESLWPPGLLELIEIPPTEGKKALSGTGRATKVQQIAAAAELGFPNLTEHEADALGLLLAYARRLHHGE